MQTQFNTSTHAAKYNDSARIWHVFRKGVGGLATISLHGNHVDFAKDVQFTAEGLRDIAQLMDNIQEQANTLQPN